MSLGCTSQVGFACYLTHSVFNTEIIKPLLALSVAVLGAPQRPAPRMLMQVSNQRFPAVCSQQSPIDGLHRVSYVHTSSRSGWLHLCPHYHCCFGGPLFWSLPLFSMQVQFYSPILGLFPYPWFTCGPGWGWWCCGQQGWGLAPNQFFPCLGQWRSGSCCHLMALTISIRDGESRHTVRLHRLGSHQLTSSAGARGVHWARKAAQCPLRWHWSQWGRQRLDTAVSKPMRISLEVMLSLSTTT